MNAGSSEGESVVDSDEAEDSEEYSEVEEDEEEGLSWDELEEEAKRCGGLPMLGGLLQLMSHIYVCTKATVVEYGRKQLECSCWACSDWASVGCTSNCKLRRDDKNKHYDEDDEDEDRGKRKRGGGGGGVSKKRRN